MYSKSPETTQSEVIGRKVAETLLSDPDIKVAIIYGSAVTDRMRPDSDVDVAVLFDRELDMDTRLALWSQLTDALGREVDLVDLYNLGGEIFHQIMTKGRVVIKNDTQAYFRLMQRMVYNEEDFMPQLRRMMDRRIRRFIDG